MTNFATAFSKRQGQNSFSLVCFAKHKFPCFQGRFQYGSRSSMVTVIHSFVHLARWQLRNKDIKYCFLFITRQSSALLVKLSSHLWWLLEDATFLNYLALSQNGDTPKSRFQWENDDKHSNLGGYPPNSLPNLSMCIILYLFLDSNHKGTMLSRVSGVPQSADHRAWCHSVHLPSMSVASKSFWIWENFISSEEIFK